MSSCTSESITYCTVLKHINPAVNVCHVTVLVPFLLWRVVYIVFSLPSLILPVILRTPLALDFHFAWPSSRSLQSMLSTHSYTPFWLCAVQQWHRTTPGLGAFLFCLLPPYRSTYQGKLSLLFVLSKPLWPLAYRGVVVEAPLWWHSQGAFRTTHWVPLLSFMGHSAFETDALQWWPPTFTYYTPNNSADVLCVKGRVVCLSVRRFFREDTKLFWNFGFLFICLAVSVIFLVLKISCFHLWVCLPPPLFFFTSCVSVCMCFHWFLYACKCWNFTTIFPSVSPLNCRCLWSLFNICCSWFTQIPKSTETALHQSKMTAREILGGWCKNNVHRHPMFFWFGVWQNLKYLIH